MPLSDLNKLFAAPWGRFQETVRHRLEASLSNGWELTQIDIAAPFGYLALSTKGGQLAIPVDPSGWSFTLSKSIPLGQLVVHVDGFRLLVTVPLDDTDPDRPRALLDAVEIEPQLRLRAPGVFPVSIELNAFDKVADAAGNVDYRAEVNQPASGGSTNSLNGTLILRLFPVAELTFDGSLQAPCHSGPIHFRSALPLSDPTKELLRVLAQRGLPRDWGNAPAPPLQPVPPGTDFRAKALGIEAAIQMHMGYAPDPVDPTAPPSRLGNVFDATYDIPKTQGAQYPRFQCFSGECDSAIWTGHYLAAESLRCATVKTTGEKQDALARVVLALGAIESLFRLTAAATGGAVRGLLCRAAFPKVGDHSLPTSPPFDQPDDPSQYYGPVEIAGLPWYGLGLGSAAPTRDQYLGVLLGLACALRLVEDPDVQQRVKALVGDIVTFLTGNCWNVPVPVAGTTPIEYEVRTTYIHEFHQQIAILRLGASADRDRFYPAYQEAAKAADLMWVPVWGSTVEPIESYYKFNLDHGFMAILFLLETDGALRQQYLRTFRMLRRAIGHHRNAWFDLVWVLADSSHARQRPGNALDQPGSAGETVADEVRSLLWEWLRRRDQVAGPNDLPRKETPFAGALESLYPGEVAEYTSGKWLSIYPLPVDIRPGSGMDFLWQRDPFSTFIEVENGAVTGITGDDPSVEAPGVDFLLAYWMAAYHNIVP